MSKINTEDGIFTNNGETGQTGEEVYQEWLENKDKPQPPTGMELLQEENVNLKTRMTTTEVDVVTLEETINTIFGGV